MDIKKICLFLIVIFTFLALLFNVLYVAELKEKTVLSDELLAGAVENLNARGITVDEEIIDKYTPERDIYFFEVSNDHFEKICKSVCVNLFGDNVVTTEFDTPDGFSVGISDKSSYEREIGRIVLSESEFSFTYRKNGISMYYGDEPIVNMQQDGLTDEILKVIDTLIRDISSSSRLGYSITGCSLSDDYLIVTAMQTIDGNEINDVYINFVLQNNEPVIISGSWITDVPKAKYHNTLTDGVNVLFKLDIEDVKTVLSERVV